MRVVRTTFTADEIAVRDLFAGFFANEGDSSVVRAAARLGHDPALWAKVCDLGAPGMAVPATAGGGDAAFTDLAVVAETYGAHIPPIPLIEHVVAARLLHHAAPDHPSTAEAITGERIATLALRPPTDNVARLVPAGAVADIVVAHHDDTLTISTAPPPDTARPNTGDLPLADRNLSGDTVALSLTAWDHALDEWRALMAVALVGLGQRAVEIGVDYAKERIQFGVPVGSFQGVQHGFADAATRLRGAHLLAHRAVWALESGQRDASRLAGMAFLFATETARFATDRSLQYHGGYGFSEEYDIQLYHRRASAWPLQIGELGLEYARLADAEFGPRQGAA